MDQLTDRDVLIATAFGKLRKTDQELLALSFWEGFSNREIGIALGCSENAATIRLHRARKRLGDLVGSGASPNNDDSDKEAS
jgi:RNA polymerase sigma-70 factor (ECF subfamily)